MRRVFRWLRWFLVVILILLIGAGAGGYAYLRASLPETSGTLSVQGIQAPVEIVRDADAVPHIYGQSQLDVLFGLGYVHAQDRLWQLEFQRRVGQGRLSEIIGAPTVPTDRFLRTLSVYRAAQSAWDNLTPEARRPIEAYTAGINTFITTRSGSSLPPEFTIFRFKPEPWSGPDVIVWQKMMSLNLSANFNGELLHHDLRAAVGSERTAQLLPGYPDDGTLIIPQQAQSYAALAAVSDQVWQLLGTGGPDRAWVGSNSWVVDGSKSTTGKPILANDPHLGAQLPSVWYVAHLSAGDFDVAGATIPGLPAVVIGHNRSITWGVTNSQMDVQDLFEERLDPTGTMAEFQGSMEPMQIITETIKVNGSADIQMRVRVTRHGPLLSDAINENQASEPESGPPLPHVALRWNALDPTDTTIQAFLGINAAQNWEQFRQALRGYITPTQNFTYADVAGNIGYLVPGNVPIRASQGGTLPAQGWTGQNEWTGWIPFDELPSVYNPPEHYIVTANNRPVSDAYPYYLSQDWALPYRAQRITDLLTAKDKLTPDDFAAIQGDTHTTFSQLLLPRLFALANPQTDQQRRALELLKTWDGVSSRESVPATIFAAWTLQLSTALVGDELGPDLSKRYNNYLFALETLNDPQNIWCDTVTTTERENCANVINTALSTALADLETRLGADMESWRWDRLHIAVFPHQPLDQAGPLRSLFSRDLPHGGGLETVNPGAYGRDPAFVQTGVPGYRQIIDLAAPDTSRFIHAGGQSGHFLSPHYADYLSNWQAVTYRTLRFTRDSVASGPTATLRLEPAR